MRMLLSPRATMSNPMISSSWNAGALPYQSRSSRPPGSAAIARPCASSSQSIASPQPERKRPGQRLQSRFIQFGMLWRQLLDGALRDALLRALLAVADRLLQFFHQPEDARLQLEPLLRPQARP